MYNAHGGPALGIGLATLLLVCLALGASPAAAQVDEGFNAQNFQAPIDPFGYVTLNGARVLEPGQVFVGGYIDYAEDPLDLRDIREGVIESMTFVHGVLSVGLLEFGDHGGGVEIGAVVPYALQMDGFGRDPRAGSFETATPPAVELPDGRLADIRGEVKIVLLDRAEPIGIALRGWGTTPTGEDKYFLSNDERFGAGGGLILEKAFSWLRIGAEADYEWIEGDTVISTRRFTEEGDPEPKLLTIDDKLHLRAGMALRLFVDDLWLVGEAHHYTRANNLWNTRRESPIELGGALRFERRVMVLVGASTGIVNDGAVGSPEYRLYAALGLTFF
jgi:hypothetical protein